MIVSLSKTQRKNGSSLLTERIGGIKARIESKDLQDLTLLLPWPNDVIETMKVSSLELTIIWFNGPSDFEFRVERLTTCLLVVTSTGTPLVSILSLPATMTTARVAVMVEQRADGLVVGCNETRLCLD